MLVTPPVRILETNVRNADAVVWSLFGGCVVFREALADVADDAHSPRFAGSKPGLNEDETRTKGDESRANPGLGKQN